MPFAYIAAGSSTRVKDGPGRLFGFWIAPAAGSSLVLADSPNLGNSGPNFNSPTSVTSTIGFLNQFSVATPQYFNAHAAPFVNALTVAASSSAKVTIFFE